MKHIKRFENIDSKDYSRIESRNYVTCEECSGTGDAPVDGSCENCYGKGRYAVMLDDKEVVDFKRNERLFNELKLELNPPRYTEFCVIDGVYTQEFMVKIISAESLSMLPKYISIGLDIYVVPDMGGVKINVSRDMDK
jgi:RecJ-like exonuclease